MPRVLLVGRPNTGKSTLFNRITQTRQSIVYPTAGVTRDLHGLKTDWNGREFLLFDAAGLETQATPDSILGGAASILSQEAKNMDVLVLVVDGREGMTASDEAAAQWARMLGKPVVVAVNKVEHSKKAVLWLADFYVFGFDVVVPTSGEHGQGVGDLLDEIVALLPPPGEGLVADRGQVLLLGRPNVGKSTLFNHLLGKTRAVVHPTAGTTRDLVEEPIALPGGPAMLVDAAGLVRGMLKKDDLQFYSEQRVRGAVKDARLVLVCLNPREGLMHQDRTLFHLALEQSRALVVLLMQSDLVPEEKRRETEFLLEEKLFVSQHFPFLWLSGQKGQGITNLRKKLNIWLDEPPPILSKQTLNSLLERWKILLPPPRVKGKSLHLKKLVMPRPGLFVLTVAGQGEMPVSYERRLKRQLIQELPLTPWVILFKVNFVRPVKK